MANLEPGLVLRIPILEHGEAGDPEIIVERHYGIDGIDLHLYGRIYAALGIQSRVIQIDPADGAVTELATRSDGLDILASLAFGTREDERDSLFITNYAVSRFGSRPGVVKLALDVPGFPLP